MASITLNDDIEGLIPKLESDCESLLDAERPFGNVQNKPLNPKMPFEILWLGKPVIIEIRRFTPLVQMLNFFSALANEPANHIYFFVNGDLVDITEHSLVTLSYYYLHMPLKIEGKIWRKKLKTPVVSHPTRRDFPILVTSDMSFAGKTVRVTVPYEANFELVQAELAIKLNMPVGSFAVGYGGQIVKYNATYSTIDHFLVRNLALAQFDQTMGLYIISN